METLAAMPLDIEKAKDKQIDEIFRIRIDIDITFLSDSDAQIGELFSNNWNSDWFDCFGNYYSNNGGQRIKNTKDWIWVILCFNCLADTHYSFYDLVELCIEQVTAHAGTNRYLPLRGEVVIRN
jgi:hypothetical protein